MLLTVAVVCTALCMGAGVSFAAHPDIPLYTFEEVSMQFQGVAQVDAKDAVPGVDFQLMPVTIVGTEQMGGTGFPYSPKMTCGNCHNGTTDRWDGAGNVDANDATATLVSYDTMNDEAFHIELGAQEWKHFGDNETGARETSQGGKPWSSTNGMWGKW
ncbi:MAG: hypothetical protein C0617_00995 [Desulfuromonas sp.]|nr:MAG: hypothetical protein C0617_00995 [Desulfuromonas sp.]